MNRWWNRALWMRLGAAQALIAASIFALHDPDGTLRTATQIQFMHGMATIACATFMNVGAREARYAPAFFQGGIVLYALPAWLAAAGLARLDSVAEGLKITGWILLGAGWLLVIHAGRSIDQE